jgi:hypothetical protein
VVEKEKEKETVPPVQLFPELKPVAPVPASAPVQQVEVAKEVVVVAEEVVLVPEEEEDPLTVVAEAPKEVVKDVVKDVTKELEKEHPKEYTKEVVKEVVEVEEGEEVEEEEEEAQTSEAPDDSEEESLLDFQVHTRHIFYTSFYSLLFLSCFSFFSPFRCLF